MTHTITALKRHPKATEAWQDCYCYDDEHVTAEPLVPQTTDTIDELFVLQGLDKPEVVRIEFAERVEGNGWTTDDQDAVIVYLNSAEAVNDGTSYIVNPLFPDRLENAWMDAGMLGEPPLVAWLCSHLCDYFPTPPKEFFAKITPLY